MKKINKITFTYLLILIVFYSFNETKAQFSFSLATAQEYSDNPFQSPIPTSSLISSLEFGTEYKFNSSGIGFGYYGNYSMFNEISNRNYFWQQLGIWNTSNNYIYGFYLEQRKNGVDYEFYNYSNYNAYLRYNFSLLDLTWFLNTSLSLTNYSSLNDLDNILGKVGIKFNRSFETKTTLIAGINFNYKNYFDTNLNDPSLIGDSLQQSFSTSAFTNQFVFFVRIAQSIFENTGFAFQYTKQNIIDGTAKYVRQLDYVYGDESQYFDDPISYDGNIVTAQLTQVLPESIILKAILSLTKKDYPSQGSYLDAEYFDESITRNDEQTILNFSISKKIIFSQSLVILNLSYRNLNNQSSSYWYDYKSSQINFGINYQF